MISENVINQWNNAAKEYSEKQRTAQNNITNWQMIKELLSDVSGLKILDAGCGDGFFSNEIKKLGADVCGCDGAKAFIDIAKTDFKNIEFCVADITKSLPYKNNVFDCVISSLVLMDICDIHMFLNETHRVLKKKGRLVFSIVHPCYFLPDWEKDENGNKLYKKVAKYWQQDEKILDVWGETTHYHRSISWYTKELKKSGFLIEEIKENPDDEQIFNSMPERQQRVPLFIAFSCVKI